MTAKEAADWLDVPIEVLASLADFPITSTAEEEVPWPALVQWCRRYGLRPFRVLTPERYDP